MYSVISQNFPIRLALNYNHYSDGFLFSNLRKSLFRKASFLLFILWNWPDPGVQLVKRANSKRRDAGGLGRVATRPKPPCFVFVFFHSSAVIALRFTNQTLETSSFNLISLISQFWQMVSTLIIVINALWPTLRTLSDGSPQFRRNLF